MGVKKWLGVVIRGFWRVSSASHGLRWGVRSFQEIPLHKRYQFYRGTQVLCRASTVVLAVFGASSGSSEDFQRVSEAYWGIRRVLGALQEVLREYELFFFSRFEKFF